MVGHERDGHTGALQLPHSLRVSVCLPALLLLSPAVHATLHPLALVLLLHSAVAIAVHHGTLAVALVVPPLTIELVSITAEHITPEEVRKMRDIKSRE